MTQAQTLLAIIKIMNAGIDYDRSKGNLSSVAIKIKARDKILQQVTSAKRK